MRTIGSRVGLAASNALLLILAAGCGGGGANGSGDREPPPPPPVGATTFTVTLQSVEATFSVDGTELSVTGGPISGATATMD
jgi:hypothetical protein